MYLVAKSETDSTPLTVSTAAQNLTSVTTSENASELMLVEITIEIRTTGTSNAGSVDIPIIITIGGQTRTLNMRSFALIGRRRETHKFSAISRIKDTISIDQGASTADAQTTLVVNDIYVWSINT